MAREHTEYNITTGKKIIIPYTAAENVAADIAVIAETQRNDDQKLAALKLVAEDAELRKNINIMTGNTQAARAYRDEKTRQGK